MTIRLITLRLSRSIAELAQPRSECGLNRLGIWCREPVFEREGLMRPGGESLRVNELLELSDQLVSQVCGRVRQQARWLDPISTRSPVGRLHGAPRIWLD